MIDIYGHIGLPRFGSVEDFVAQMNANDVDRALVSTAQYCPDIIELARAARLHPERFRIVGLPVGPSLEIRCEHVSRQLSGGFSGIRIPGVESIENPRLLDVVGRAGAFLIVVALEPWLPFQDALLQFLDRYPKSFVIGGHFAGVASPSLIGSGGALHPLFSHQRFHVVFTRQGSMEEKSLNDWARALIEVVGWTRLLWGSEWPVALWRNESYADTVRFIDRFAPSEEEREAFFHGNAQKLLFDGPAPRVRPFTSEDDVMSYRTPGRIHLLPAGMDLPEEQHLRLMRAFFRREHLTKTYREFLQELMLRGLEEIDG